MKIGKIEVCITKEMKRGKPYWVAYNPDDTHMWMAGDTLDKAKSNYLQAYVEWTVNGKVEEEAE